MGALDRLPPWSTTGVGSLPYTDGRTAVARAVGDYDLPFCPQLPRLEGDMVAEWLGADPRRCGWSPDRDRERPRAWERLRRELMRAPPAHDVVKLQVTGPLTLAVALERGAGRGPGDAALRREVAAWLAANVAGQVAALRERGFDTLVMVDEPALDAVAGIPGVERSWDPLRALGAPWGLHLCCAVPWDVVDCAAPDVLSFDLVPAPVDRRGATALRGLLRRGGRVAWGVLPVHRGPVARRDRPARRRGRALRRRRRAVAADRLVRHRASGTATRGSHRPCAHGACMPAPST